MGKLIMNNVVTKEHLRPIQSKTLNEIRSILELSFGPNGSNTCIKMENALSRYSKDGHTILGSINYNGIIEQSIKDDLESITRHIVKTVGDGTTSAVILSSLIFDRIYRHEDKFKPVEIVKALDEVVTDITAIIKDSATDLTLQDVYDIAMISTNGNEFVANTLRDIYEEYGNGVFIDVVAGLNEDFAVKEYNGMVLTAGYADSCYVNNTENNTATIDNPEVYFFEHPVDTRELGVYFDSIISKNIIYPLNAMNKGENADMVPTVIFAPKISQDMTSLMDTLTSYMAQMPAGNKLPICIISEYQDIENLMDLAKMCGAKMIRKYIDQNVYKLDVEQGRAPTPDTIWQWAGHCDQVVAHSDKTVFVRPVEIYNPDGSFSDLYSNLVAYYEAEIAKAKEGGDTNIREIGSLKRRLNSLKSNMVELHVGGISQADRDSLRDLVEDAVLNIRSAAQNGVGFGANVSAAVAVDDAFCNTDYPVDSLKGLIIADIDNAYTDLIDILYSNTPMFEPDHHDSPKAQAIDYARTYGQVYNIREKAWRNNVKTSIASDITVLETVCRIVGIMATCNQFIVPTAMHNVYENNN